MMLTPHGGTISAHPGGTDSDGGHHCWTDCGSHGYEDGEYHFHDGRSADSYIEDRRMDNRNDDIFIIVCCLGIGLFIYIQSRKY